MAPASKFQQQPGDGWVECHCGNRHWGLHGAAGLLLLGSQFTGVHPEPPLTHIVMQLRALKSHHGGTWGIPGGARMPGEGASAAALREATEEAGVDAASVVIGPEYVMDHGDWSYTTVIARSIGRDLIAVEPTDWESQAIEWVQFDEITELDLLPSFAASWPEVSAMARSWWKHSS